ncbi:hypothetical protein H696_04323 [Fonticula alba]|uniref:RRM domain-containing protein n=1 Tax=Fonticula alba TaxID=691883 RepID=A0A058Z3P1_FONAL|nr:hypothetical protein H696_04323 [Fonticula alba]KCV68904.1 hypothetical protein H696_04323 [Fonticula alba]|eukprot:XP_009496475.1 hypothetical protein H696_04323 [Fonticula alba]
MTEKRKRSEESDTSAPSDPVDKLLAGLPEVKRTRGGRRKAQAAPPVEEPAAVAESPEVPADDKKADKPAKKAGPPKFIVFVGNLPYNVKAEEVREELFKPLVEYVRDVRVRAEKGFAFVEFKNYTSYSMAIRMNKTSFKGREVKVEATVGGGGNSAARKQKLMKKKVEMNKKVHVQLKTMLDDSRLKGAISRATAAGKLPESS